MNNIKLVIFDLDGTIVDSMPYWAKTPLDCLASYGVFSKDDVASEFLSLNLEESVTLFQNKYKVNDTKENIINKINSIMEKNYMENVVLKEGVEEFLEYLYQNNIKMAIATATEKRLVNMLLDKLSMKKYFSYVITSSEIGSSKQKPDIYINCARHFAVKNEESIVFEDLPYGIISSSKAGFHTVGVYDEASFRLQDTIINNAEYYLTSFSDIRKTLKQLFR